jgi:hypothetical protein
MLGYQVNLQVRFGSHVRSLVEYIASYSLTYLIIFISNDQIRQLIQVPCTSYILGFARLFLSNFIILLDYGVFQSTT